MIKTQGLETCDGCVPIVYFYLCLCTFPNSVFHFKDADIAQTIHPYIVPTFKYLNIFNM